MPRGWSQALLRGAQEQENEKQWVKVGTWKGPPKNEEEVYFDVGRTQRQCGVSSSEDIQKPSDHLNNSECQTLEHPA